MAMDELHGTIWIWILGPFALIAFAFATLALWNYRRMKSTPTTAIKDLQEGKVEVKGTAQARGPLLESPATRSPCVCYALFLNETIGSGEHSYSSTFFHEVKSASFVVNDGTGVATIKTDESSLEVWKNKAHRPTGASTHLILQPIRFNKINLLIAWDTAWPTRRPTR